MLSTPDFPSTTPASFKPPISIETPEAPRGTSAAKAHLAKERDFFRFKAPIAMVEAAHSMLPGPKRVGAGVVLDLQRREQSIKAMMVGGKSIPVIGFPAGTHNLVQLMTQAPVFAGGCQDTVDVLLPRRTFDKLADAQGAPRLSKMNMQAGVAKSDKLMQQLGACLDHALHWGPPGGGVIDQITEALHLHIAQRYGALTPPRRSAAGGLAPWQLRLARNTLDHNLDGAIPLEDVAQKCGLSTSHFSRAFARSTGLAPHQWLIQRRVEIAKDLILYESMPLAEVAVAGGFSDQSHLTRTFAAVTGLTPGRWRASQQHVVAGPG